MILPRKPSTNGGVSERQKDFLYSHVFSFLVVLYRNHHRSLSVSSVLFASLSSCLLLVSWIVDDLWLLASVTMEDDSSNDQNTMALCDFLMT